MGDNIIDDETAWFPKDQTMTVPKPPDPTRNNDDETNNTVIFSMANADMGSLNRFLHAGRVLPLDRNTYCLQAAILDQNAITQPIWEKVDGVITVYNNVHNDCSGFLGDKDSAVKRWKPGPKAPRSQRIAKTAKDDDGDFDKLCTWDKMNSLAQKIYSYSLDAGDKDPDDSYYVLLLTWCNDFNNTDDPKQQESIRQDIMSITTELLDNIDVIKSRIGKVNDALKGFETYCQANKSTLEGLDSSMAEILKQELGDVSQLKDKIQDYLAQIQVDQGLVDAARFQQKMTAAYVWIPVIGNIAGPIVFAECQKNIDLYEGKITELKNLIEQTNDKITLANTIQANVTSFKKHATDLANLIGPAMNTVQALEGGWNEMDTQVRSIYDKAASFENNIPSVALTKPKLNKISSSWVTLNEYVTAYIEMAQITPEVAVTSVDDYLVQLDQTR